MPIQKICLTASGKKTWVAGYIYVNHIRFALQQNYPELEVHLILNPLGDARYFQNGSPNQRFIQHYAWHHNMPLYKKVAGWGYALLKNRPLHSLEKILDTVRPDFVYPALKNIRTYKTAHWIPDLQHRLLPDFFPGQIYEKREQNIRRLISTADHLVMSSQNALSHLRQFYEIEGKQLSVLPFTAFFEDSFFNPSPIEFTQKYDLPERFFIFSSQFWKHKNHLNLFRAIALAKEKAPDICLILTGAMQDFRNPGYTEELSDFRKKNNLEKNIVPLGLLPRMDQVQLLRQAVAIVQPSYFEGWSALVEDARALGKRIILSDIPIHREQDPPRARFFNPNDPKQLAELLVHAWQNCKAGADSMQEQLAQKNNQLRLRAFADNFIQIAEKSQNV